MGHFNSFAACTTIRNQAYNLNNFVENAPDYFQHDKLYMKACDNLTLCSLIKSTGGFLKLHTKDNNKKKIHACGLLEVLSTKKIYPPIVRHFFLNWTNFRWRMCWRCSLLQRENRLNNMRVPSIMFDYVARQSFRYHVEFMRPTMFQFSRKNGNMESKRLLLHGRRVSHYQVTTLQLLQKFIREIRIWGITINRVLWFALIYFFSSKLLWIENKIFSTKSEFIKRT